MDGMEDRPLTGAVEPGVLYIVYDYSCVMIRAVVVELSFDNYPGNGMILVIISGLMKARP